MDIENKLFQEYKEYILSKVDYDVKIFPKTPQSFVSFPTIVFIESSNTDYMPNASTDGLEYVDQLTYTVELYTKDMIVGNKRIASQKFLSDLKQLTFEFFRQVGFERSICERGEYLDFTVDRWVIVEQGKINNWNMQIR